MFLLQLALDTPAENLALDEALLLSAEEDDGPSEVLRLWESPQRFVVLGSSSKIRDEADTAACRADGIEVLRRSSGGAAILTGPGCLMYAVVLSFDRHPHLRSIDVAHRMALERLASAIGRRVEGVRHAGTSDLAFGNRKFSGNSMRCKRRHLLYHGTILYDFPVDLIGRYLKTPPRQPEYRAARPHSEFVANLPLARSAIVEAVTEAFDAHDPLVDWPRRTTADLVAEKYGCADWSERL